MKTSNVPNAQLIYYAYAFVVNFLGSDSCLEDFIIIKYL